jgi:hypothetical protein
VPDIANLLNEPPVAGGLTLIDTLGREADLACAIADQELLEGAVLRLVAIADAPPPPEVSDVADAVAATYDATTKRWTRTHLAIGTGIGLGAASAAGSLTFGGHMGWFPPALYLASAIIAVTAGRGGRSGAGLLVAAVALGAVPATAQGLVAQHFPERPALVWVLAVALAWFALGLSGTRHALVGAAVGVGLSAVTLLLALVNLNAAEIAAIVGVLVTGCLGVLPGIALGASGLTELDDRVIAGEASNRDSVAERVDRAYAVFGWAVYALAAAGSGALAVLVATGTLWSGLLATALALVLALRTRIMPLAYQAWPLWVASIGGVVAGAWAFTPMQWPDWAVPSGSLVLAVLLVLAYAAHPRRHTRVRWRRLGDLVESAAALAMVPFLLGIFGVYSLALGMFP